MKVAGVSKVKKRVYVTADVPISVRNKLEKRGYEVEVIGKIIALYTESDAGKCSTPYNGLHARHCYGDPPDKVLGKNFKVVRDGIEEVGKVVYDPNNHVPFFRAVYTLVANLFGAKKGLKDWVKVEPVYRHKYGRVVSVVSAGTVDGSILFVPYIETNLLGSYIRTSSDFPEPNEVHAKCEDFGVFWVTHAKGVWPLELYLCRVLQSKVVPGNSGSPVFLV